MRNVIVLLLACCQLALGAGKTNIGSFQVRSAPGAQATSSLFEVNTTTKGAIPAPKMTTAQRDAISSPTAGLLVYNTDTNSLNQYNGSAWVGVGSGTGGINYLAPYHDAEGGVGSWTAYDDAASSPVDCTGGTVDGVTWTVSDTDPLEQNNSFLFSKDAADRQGEGVSTVFDVDPAFRAKGHVVRFYYSASGSYSPDDVTVWVKPVDGSDTTARQLSVYELGGTTSGPPTYHVGEFQTTSDATQYRLCFHAATTNASAYDLKLDLIEVGPSEVVYGTLVTAWQSFTPTGSWTTNTTYTGQWRRIGDTMEVEYKVATSGAPDSTTLTLNLPAGHSIDTAKLLEAGTDNWMQAISGNIVDAGTNTFRAAVRYSSATAVTAVSHTSNASGSPGYFTQVTQASPMTWANGDKLLVRFSVPISGWGAQTAVGQYDGRTVSFSGSHSTTQAVTANTTNISQNTVLKDSHGAWDGDEFVAPTKGDYAVSIASCDTATSAAFRAFINGTGSIWLGGGTTNHYGGGLGILPNISAGDRISIRSNQTGTLCVTYISISLLSGRQQISAADTIAARYATAAGQSIPNLTATIVDFGTKVFDYTGMCTTGANFKCTAPISGLYEVCAMIAFAGGGGWAEAEEAGMHVDVNGTLHSILSYMAMQDAHTAFTPVRTGCLSVRLNAGDYVDVRAYQGSGAALSLYTSAFYNWMEVKRVGNY